MTIGLTGVSIGGLPVQPPREWTSVDSSTVQPPQDVRDALAWDRYWKDQAARGLRPHLFNPYFTDDLDLIAYMTSRGFRSALCVGSGISPEPRTLAAAGFDVTALDFSAAAARLAQAVPLDTDLLNSFMGGTLSYVTDDLLDAAVCPGPFDVVIERRWQPGDALEALARRVRPDGLFVSHYHSGWWKGPMPPVHVHESWFRDQGWTIWRGDLRGAPHERVANLRVSIG